LVDNGRFTYQPGKWNSWFKGPESHNVLLLDGHPLEQAPHSVRKPLPIEFTESEDYVFTAARGRFHRGAEHSMPPTLRAPVSTSRSILYDKRGFALILDHLVIFDAHRLSASWNFH